MIGIILGGRLGYVIFYNPEYYFDNFLEISDSKPLIELITMLNEATPRDKLRIVIKFVKRKTKLLFFEVNNLFIKKSISFI